MKKIRNWSIIFFLMLLLIWGMYAFLFDWVVPKTAQLTIPRKWQMLPIKQSKDIVHDYLGLPIMKKSIATDYLYEEWEGGVKGKMYTLRIQYLDSIAMGYTIHYQYENWLLSKKYLIDSFYLQ